MHRTGKKSAGKQSVILKFCNWDKRVQLYRSRPTTKSPRKNKTAAPHGFKSVSLDITPRNIDLLNKVRSIISSRYSRDDAYAYADVNCNLVLSFKKKFHYFKSEKEFNVIIDKLCPVDVEPSTPAIEE